MVHLTGFMKIVWMMLACDILLVPVPSSMGDAYAVKWVCKR